MSNLQKIEQIMKQVKNLEQMITLYKTMCVTPEIAGRILDIEVEIDQLILARDFHYNSTRVSDYEVSAYCD